MQPNKITWNGFTWIMISLTMSK